jgi:hypothetical protein
MRRLELGVVLGLLLLAAAAPACNVPVFRYALEKWRPEPYRVSLFHRGPMDDPIKTGLDLLRKQGSTEEAHTNVEWAVVNLADKPEEAQQALYEKHGKPALPWLHVQTRNLEGAPVTVWAGPATRANVESLVDSPARRKLARRILSGDTAVWLLLDSGDRDKDDAAEALLLRELKRLEETLKLPTLTNDPEDRLAPKGPPLKLAFSVVRIRHDDQAEMMLRTMLLRSESDIEESKGPMAFPIFARGRTLGGLIGAGVTAENISDSCRVLIAPCSCKVKEQSPGFDLLLSADWEGILETGPIEPDGKKVELPPARSKPLAEAEEVVKDEESGPMVAPMVLYGGIGLAGLLVLLTGLWLLRSGCSGPVAA